MKTKLMLMTAVSAGLFVLLLCVLTTVQGSTPPYHHDRDWAMGEVGAPVDPDTALSPAAPGKTLATILEISIPDFALQKWYSGTGQDGTRGRRTLDLWNYTTYDENPAALTYQVTQPGSSSYLAFEIVNGHFLSMTVTTHIKDRTIPMEVQVTDGVLVASDEFTVTTAPGPYIDFYDVYGGYPLDDPLNVVAGGSLEEPLNLDDYSGNKEGDSIEGQTFTIVNSPPASLGITIYTDPNAGPFDCVHCLDIHPTGEAVGAHEVEVQIENSYGLTATDTFRVRVVGKVLLPMVLRNH